MAALIFNLSHVDVDNVQRSWPKIEKLMLPIGIRVFISILEKRCEKMPVCRQRACCNNKERYDTCTYMKRDDELV